MVLKHVSKSKIYIQHSFDFERHVSNRVHATSIVSCKISKLQIIYVLMKNKCRKKL